MTFTELGILFYDTRVRSNLSIEDVANSLKISPRLVRELEAGNPQAFPHIVYAKGLIKSYAKLINISLSEIESVFDVGEKEKTEFVQIIPDQHNGSGLKLTLKIIIFLCILGFAAYWYYNSYYINSQKVLGQLSQSSSLETESAQNAIAESVKPAPSLPVEKTQPVAEINSVVPADNKNINPPQIITGPVEENEPVKSKFKASSEKQITRNTNQNLAGLKNDNIENVQHIVLYGLAECWVHAITDEAETRQFTVQQGEVFALSFVNSLELKLGNAGGLTIKYKEQELKALGKDGEIKTLRFPLSEQG